MGHHLAIRTALLAAATTVSWVLVNGVLPPPANNAAPMPLPTAPSTLVVTLAENGGMPGPVPVAEAETVLLPAHAQVAIEIVDRSTAGSAARVPTAVRGAVGGVVQIETLSRWNPHAFGAARWVHSFGRRSRLACTFTVPAFGTSVPVASGARETFTIRTGSPGFYGWRCAPVGQRGGGVAGWFAVA